jgi:hypothetical protein
LPKNSNSAPLSNRGQLLFSRRRCRLGIEIRDAYRSGYAVLAATALLTVLAWLYVLLGLDLETATKLPEFTKVYWLNLSSLLTFFD